MTKERGGGGLGGGHDGGTRGVAAEAAVSLLPRSSLSSHLRGSSFLSLFK